MFATARKTGEIFLKLCSFPETKYIIYLHSRTSLFAKIRLMIRLSIITASWSMSCLYYQNMYVDNSSYLNWKKVLIYIAIINLNIPQGNHEILLDSIQTLLHTNITSWINLATNNLNDKVLLFCTNEYIVSNELLNVLQVIVQCWWIYQILQCLFMEN